MQMSNRQLVLHYTVILSAIYNLMYILQITNLKVLDTFFIQSLAVASYLTKFVAEGNVFFDQPNVNEKWGPSRKINELCVFSLTY